MQRSYFNNAACAIFVYDLTNAESLDNITRWLDNTKDHAPENILKVLVGNQEDKVSLVDSQQIDFVAVDFDRSFRVSAKEGSGINKMINYVC